MRLLACRCLRGKHGLQALLCPVPRSQPGLTHPDSTLLSPSTTQVHKPHLFSKMATFLPNKPDTNTRSNSSTSHGAESHPTSDRGLTASPPPDLENEVRTPSYSSEPSLGVYFTKEEHESNDVIAALRVSKRILEETIQRLDLSVPLQKQLKMNIQSHDHDFTQWIISKCGIPPKKRISVKALPLFKPLATYVTTLQDITSDLPGHVPRQNSMRSLVRRLSSTGSNCSSSKGSNSSSSKDSSNNRDRRFAVNARKLADSFEKLRECVSEFKSSEERENASIKLAESARKETGIPHELCLPGTRTTIVNELISSLESTETKYRVWCLQGTEGEGKSSIAATVACEMKRKGKLGGALFLTEGGQDQEAKTPKHQPHRFSFLRPPRQTVVPKTNLESLTNLLGKLPPNAQLVVIDGLEHLLPQEAESLMKRLSNNLSTRQGLRLLLTSRSRESPWLSYLQPPGSIKFVSLEEVSSQSKNEDVSRYISSRFCLDLSVSQQQLIVDAADGNFRTAVRLCDELEDSGITERGLDIVVYRELQRKHPGHVKVILA